MPDLRIKGIDVAKWEGLVNWKQARVNGARFAIAKASQWVADPRFAENWRNAKSEGFPRGAYHYLDWGLPETDQAKIFCDTMRGDWGEIPPCLDLEMDPRPYGLSAALVSGKAWNFLTYVEKITKRTPMIYTGYYFWNDWGSDGLGWARFPLWLPWYASEAWIRICSGGTGAPKPWKNWKFWQRTDRASGVAYGCQSMQVDENLFNGTEEDLAVFCGGTLPPVPVPLPGLNYVTLNACNVRSGPSIYYPITRVEKEGALVILKSTKITNTYIQLVDDNWITYSFLKQV
jgi:lysozyme